MDEKGALLAGKNDLFNMSQGHPGDLAPTPPTQTQPQTPYYNGSPYPPYQSNPNFQYAGPYQPASSYQPAGSYQAPPSSGAQFGNTGISVRGSELNMTAFGSSVSLNSDLIGQKDQGDHPFLYRADLSCCTRCLLCFTPVIPCIEPFVVVTSLLEKSSKMRFGQYRVRFDGSTGDYCCNVCMCNTALKLLTCCLWEICGCAEDRKGEWIDHHLHLFV